jgi:putative holliday junction resolvase
MALDVGAARIGVAVAHAEARLPSPLTTLPNTSEVFDEIAKLAEAEEVGQIVVGLPRNLSGETTPQTVVAETFAQTLAAQTGLPVELQDEALTSVKAETELRRRGVKYSKGDIDALAATYILEDYLHAQKGAEG